MRILLLQGQLLAAEKDLNRLCGALIRRGLANYTTSVGEPGGFAASLSETAASANEAKQSIYNDDRADTVTVPHGAAL
ncbi:MAG: hypothetical protein HY696_03000 [Deltaproteobacteria bacterium]|nr:hypothetical protein [Deltaproteobacteria bacterium]